MNKHLQGETALEDPIIGYLEATLKEELRPRAVKKNRNKRIFSSFSPLFSRKGNSKDKEIYVPSPIVVPHSFLLAIKHANTDLKEIDFHAKHVHAIAEKNDLNLKFREDYFQLRLEAHIGREPSLIDSVRIPIFFIAFLSIVIFGNFISPGEESIKLLLVVASLVGLVESLCKPFYRDKLSVSTLAYRYCIFVIKRAQKIQLNM